MAEIKLETVAKTFGTFTAVKGVDFTVDHGSFFVILGPSGCGKTTTLRMMAGLELPTSGRILLDGEDVTALPASARDIAFVFQLFALYPHMNVRQNIGFPLRCQNYPRAEIRQSVEETARLLRIDHLLERRVGGLSGGDRQRVALGRAIVRRPKAFLMDEPLGALDSEFRRLMCGELRELHDRIDATTVYITHDQLEAMAMADRIAIMNQGRVEQIGTPQEIYDRPEHDVRGRLHRRAADELSRCPCLAAARRSQYQDRRRTDRNAGGIRGSCRGQVRAWCAARECVVRRCLAAARQRDWR